VVGHRGQDYGDEYLIMKESDIMGVLVEAKAEKKAA
jgi:co-chaperonin GroES (HSP10)